MTDVEGHRLSDLPEEVCIKIASHLGVRDRASLAQSAKMFRYMMDYGQLKFHAHDDTPIDKIQSFVRFSANAVISSISSVHAALCLLDPCCGCYRTGE